MIADSLTITKAAYIDGGEDTTQEARSKFKDNFPARSVRRMTHLGILSGMCLKDLDTDENTPIVYASTYAESRSLEAFIESFPTPSPALFQSSIHPSAIEQVLIPNKQSIRNFYPITSDKNLGGKALESIFINSANRRILVGGEERGSWLTEYGLASDIAFSFALQLEATSDAGIGRIYLDRSTAVDTQTTLELPDLAIAVRDRLSVKAPSLALEAWIHLTWT